MNITVQYPITDCRLFCISPANCASRTSCPPIRKAGNTSGISEPCRTGISRKYYYCVGENTFCNARHALPVPAGPRLLQRPDRLPETVREPFLFGRRHSGKIRGGAFRIQPDRLNPENGSAYRQLLDFHFGHEVRINDAKGKRTRFVFSDAGPPWPNSIYTALRPAVPCMRFENTGCSPVNPS